MTRKPLRKNGFHARAHPEASSRLGRSGTWCPSGVRLRSEIHLIHASGEGLLIRREKMPMAIERHLNRRVSEMGLHSFRVGSGRDEKRRTAAEVLATETAMAADTLVLKR